MGVMKSDIIMKAQRFNGLSLTPLILLFWLGNVCSPAL